MERLVVLLALFALGQVGLTYYLVWRGRSADAEPGAESLDTPGPSERDHAPEGRITCPHCGARNEAGYSFCRSCAGALSTTGEGSGGSIGGASGGA